MKRRVIAFDLDNTLADSKSPITEQMADLLNGLLRKFQVCVISGGKFEQFEEQLLNHLETAPRTLTALHIMPADRVFVVELRGHWIRQSPGEAS